MGQGLATGHVLRGKYRIEQVLGRGGMGTVHVATHIVIGQRVAIKIVNFSSHPGDQAHVFARFHREARAASLLESEHVVRILDVDSTEDGDPFMVMELLQGDDLGALLKRGGRLPIGEVVGYVLQACEALAEAHAVGIVHRDLKPSNLFRTETVRGEPWIKLLDFGISKLAEPGDDLALTATNAVVGSPLFMSPEQLLSSRDVDHRSDIWSLGVTFYQLLSGTLPFESSTATGLGAQIVATEPRPLSEVLPDVPLELERAVMCCLARAKQNRFDDVVSLARACAPFAIGDGAAAIAAVERAAERGARGRPPLPHRADPEAAPPGEASGERWTRSQGAPPSADPRVTASAAGLLSPRQDRDRAPSPPPPPLPPPPPDSATVEPPALRARRSRPRWIAAAGALGAFAVLATATALGWTRLRHRPAPVGPRACVAFVVTGDTHTCARLADGSVTCWGDNRFGQLGAGNKDSLSRARVALGNTGITKVFLPAGDGDITSDRAVFGCAITTENALYCWGDNRYGQLGTGDANTRLVPTRVEGLAGEVSRAANGAGHACAQMSDGSLSCWGRNTAGQLGTGDTTPRATPARIAIPVAVDRIEAGGNFTCARGGDSSLWCFGANEHGQLGIGTTVQQTKPASVTALAGQVVRFATGAAHACAYTVDGAVWCWGDNSAGQLGTGDTSVHASPVKITAAGSVNQIFAGGAHTCALRVEGSLWCWGDNRYGQLGTGDTNPRSTPVRISPDVLGNQISAAYAGGAHTCAVKVDGSVWCWGNNQYGQLGAGVGRLATVPTQVMPPCQ